MKIYLAARYSRHPEMRQYRGELERLGHVVTSRWINGEHQMAESTMFSSEGVTEVERFANEDFDDLMKSDCVISFTEAPRSHTGRGGRHVEFGIALGNGMDVIVVGHRENVFHYMPEVMFFETWEDALGDLKP